MPSSIAVSASLSLASFSLSETELFHYREILDKAYQMNQVRDREIDIELKRIIQKLTRPKGGILAADEYVFSLFFTPYKPLPLLSLSMCLSVFLYLLPLFFFLLSPILS